MNEQRPENSASAEPDPTTAESTMAEPITPEPTTAEPITATPPRPTRVRPAPRPGRSTRSFVRELLTITAGVLIALSVEGLREWSQQRRLVRQAVAMIAMEMRDNLSEAESVIENAELRQRNLDNALGLANALLEGQTSTINQVDLGFTIAELSAASWETAERTGALAHMNYEQARAYSRVYEVQALFAAHQDRTMAKLEAAAASLAIGDPRGALPGDIELFRQHVLALMGELAIEQELARMLVQSYREVTVEEAPAGTGS
jgi:hypothetical protein